MSRFIGFDCPRTSKILISKEFAEPSFMNINKFGFSVATLISGLFFLLNTGVAKDLPKPRIIPSNATSPANNPSSIKKIALGRELFFDTRLSSTKTISCNSCHNILNSGVDGASGTDNLTSSVGVFGAHGNRNSPTIWNVGLRTAFFWDGRASTLEQQAVGPIMNPLEMGMYNSDSVVATLQNIPAYPEKFRIAFGVGKSKGPYKITIDDVAKSIAAFERTLMTPNSPFDRYQLGEKNALTESALRGWEKFQMHGCIACHAAPTFDNKDYYIRFPLHEATEYDRRYGFTKDEGRYEVTHDFKDRNVWRVPSLQNIQLTAPYFHNGKVDSLSEAVRIMAKSQLRKTLPEEDVKDIVEFLKSLTGIPNRQK
jgi:cytochrome c peroxidase